MPIARETAQFSHDLGTTVAHTIKTSRRRSRPTPDHTAPDAVDSATLATMPIEDVWSLFHQDPTQQIRNFLVERWHHLVVYQAHRIHKRLPSQVDVNDLISIGGMGLMEAIELFNPARGIKFETYCVGRIRGAILDELRSMDWVPRLVRQRSAKVEKIRQRLETVLGRNPTEAEISEALGVDAEEVKKIIRDGSAVTINSLNRQRYQSDGSREVCELDVLQDSTQANPITEIQGRDLKELITKGLSRAERLIVVLYYYEQMTMKEIGATLDLSESRVSQLHSLILARLKAQMQHREREFEPVAPY